MQRYRSDIDGLRATAVLPVVAFHAGLALVPGGFVGVDVFFVISGYLICGVIAREIAEGRFSLATFYKRRILRIVPAFVAMLLATSALAYHFMLPTELDDFSRSLLAATSSVSNIFFAGQSGYFDAPALAKPLLHTWSLGVEEQFYVVFPLLLMLVARRAPGRLRTIVAGMAAVSLLAAIALYVRLPISVFYEMPFRFWELALGALAALGTIPAPKTALTRNAAGAFGLALILFAVFRFSAATPFPVATLVPCLGAVLVILAGETGSSVAGRCLSLRPVVFVGLISYSLYLWHWPIIVFQNADAMIFHDSSTYAAKLGLIALSLAVAALSWRFIEQPFRRGAPRFTLPLTFGAAGAGAAVLAGVALFALASNGAAFRFPPAAVAISAYLGYNPDQAYRQDRCFVARFGDFDRPDCLHLASDRPNVLLMGDSHGAHLWWGLSSTFTDVNVLQATASGCKPLVIGGLMESPECRALMTYVFGDFLKGHKVDEVLLSAQWREADVPKIAATLAALRQAGVTPVLVGPIPQYDYALPRLLADAIRYDAPGLPDTHRAAGIRVLDGTLRDLAAKTGTRYISLVDTLCQDGRCAEYAARGVPVQFDYGHLTAEGSTLVAQRLDTAHAFP